MTFNCSLFLSEKEDWGTPQSLFDSLDKEFSFDLDVCATKENSKCNKFFTIKDNALYQNWYGTCWMNPPYGRSIGNWVQKAKRESYKDKTKVICLLPCRTDTQWWHSNVMYSKEIRFLSRRLKFIGANNMAPFPAAIVIFDGTQSPIVKSFSF